jgi:hypothetical protein
MFYPYEMPEAPTYSTSVLLSWTSVKLMPRKTGVGRGTRPPRRNDRLWRVGLETQKERLHSPTVSPVADATVRVLQIWSM